MVTHRRNFSLFLLLSVVSLLVPVTSQGIMRKVELTEMVNRAGSIIHGTVLSNESRIAEDGTIYTYTTLSVIEDLAGIHKGKTIVIRNMGGKVGERGLRVSDVPTFESGEEVILFVEPKARVEETDLVGWEQGKFTIEDGTVLRNGKSVEEFKLEVRKLLAEFKTD